MDVGFRLWACQAAATYLPDRHLVRFKEQCLFYLEAMSLWGSGLPGATHPLLLEKGGC